MADILRIEVNVVKMAELAANPHIDIQQRIKDISICKADLVRKIVAENAEMRVKSFTDKTKEEDEANIQSSANYIHTVFTKQNQRVITLKSIGERATERMREIGEKFREAFSEKFDFTINEEQTIAVIDDRSIAVNNLTIKVLSMKSKPPVTRTPKAPPKPAFPVYDKKDSDYHFSPNHNADKLFQTLTFDWFKNKVN